MKLIQYPGSGVTIQIVFHAAYIIFIFWFMIVESRSLRRQGCRAYFSQLWNWMEWGQYHTE